MPYCDEDGQVITKEKHWCMEPEIEKAVRELREQTEKLIRITYSLSKRIKQLEMKVWGKEQK